MNFALILKILSYAPTVINLIRTAASLKSVPAFFAAEAPDLAKLFQEMGAALWPKGAPVWQTAAAIMSAYSPDTVKWVQNAINDILASNPQLQAKISQALAVDGLYGPLTTAAVEAVQSLFGLTVDGIAGDATQALLQGLIAKLDGSKVPGATQ